MSASRKILIEKQTCIFHLGMCIVTVYSVCAFDIRIALHI